MSLPRTWVLPRRPITIAVLISSVALGWALGVLGADPAAPQEDTDRPKILEVHPPENATNVDPITEIRIRFDRPMDPTRAALDWNMRGEAGYRLRGEIRYSPDTHEFALPVYLTPGRKHQMTANREEALRKGGYEGFRSASGVTAATSTWAFTTATARPAGAGAGPAPRVASITPPSDTEVALFTPLQVTFDRPMDPSSYGLGMDGPEHFGRGPAIQRRAEYEERERRFTLLMRFPPQWNGEFRLEGFRGADGVAAEPVRLKYRTLRQPFSPVLQQRIDRAGRDPSATLRGIVERARGARRGLKNISEQALTTMASGSLPDWHQRYDLEGARFRMQGDRKFVGIIDGVMRMPFRVGSDGTTCWFRRGEKVFALPFDQVEEKRLRFCDPFNANGDDDVDRVIRERKLEYLGEATVRGRRCFQIRSYDITFLTPEIMTPMIRWSIDAETLLPARVEMDDTIAIDYVDVRLNEPIADEEFLPAVAAGAEAARAEPLVEGYTRRFLKVDDGSGGRMSVRWGMTGPKGTNSSGLN